MMRDLRGPQAEVALACIYVACELPNVFGSPTERENIDNKRFMSIVVF